MPTSFDLVALLILAYVAGSFPTGVILGHLKGIDVRAVGSGNIGATNVTRALGSRFGVYTLVGDLLKGFLPVLLARYMAPTWPWISAVAFLCVAGHCFSIFLDFNGGKGVATSAGVFLAIAPFATIIAAVVWLAIVLATRVSSFGAFAALPAMLVMLIFPQLDALGMGEPNTRLYLPLAFAIAVVVVFRHKANLRRMLEGAEHSFKRGV